MYIYMGKILKSQFIENFWRLMYHIWLRYFINQKHGNISTSRLMDGLWPLFPGHMNTCINDFFFEAPGPMSVKFLQNICRCMGYILLQMVAVCWQKWLPCPYMFKTVQKSSSPELRKRKHSFAEIDHEIFSTVILSLPLIQEGKLSVTCERMCTEYWLTA